MRVIAGTARHMVLTAPEGNDTRPTQDGIRETLFNILQMDIAGSIFVDLFAGSGAVGIEAISRGAKKAYFAELSSKALKHLIKNLETTKFTDRAVVLKSDAVSSLTRIKEEEADIIYIDPPYESKLYEPVLKELIKMPYVTKYTKIIIECGAKMDMEFIVKAGYEIVREKPYKHNKHVFLKRAD